MTKVLLATVAILAFTAPSFAHRIKLRSSATIRCFLVLPGSRYCDDEMSSRQCPACRWWHHEGYRPGSSDTRISGNGFGG